ncbi:MAG TPA: hypothetical protein VIY49_37550 [Bryobacteraceae bacterium]
MEKRNGYREQRFAELDAQIAADGRKRNKHKQGNPPPKSGGNISFKRFKAEFLTRQEEADAQNKGEDSLPVGVDRNSAMMYMFGAASGYDPIHVFSWPDLWKAARRSKLVCLMREAASRGHTNPFREFLDNLLELLEVDPPPGVITPFTKDPGVKKPKKWHLKLHDMHGKDGNPPPTNDVCRGYAERLFPSEYRRAGRGGKTERMLVNRVGNVLRRCLKNQSATNSLR